MTGEAEKCWKNVYPGINVTDLRYFEFNAWNYNVKVKTCRNHTRVATKIVSKMSRIGEEICLISTYSPDWQEKLHSSSCGYTVTKSEFRKNVPAVIFWHGFSFSPFCREFSPLHFANFEFVSHLSFWFDHLTSLKKAKNRLGGHYMGEKWWTVERGRFPCYQWLLL